MQNQTNLEMLYTIIENLQVIKAPIAIKGGLLLNASLQEHMSNMSRMTRDIDGNWLNKQPNMQDMRTIIEQAVQISYPDYTVRIRRNYNEKQSAGFEILNEHQEPITSLDIDVNKPTIATPYVMNGISFQGISMEQVLCDKISVLSSPQIMRRTKDLLDVYAITQTIPYDNKSLITLLSQRDLGDFSTLSTRKEEIQHAYNKLRGVTNKPDFEHVYATVSDYCKNITVMTKNAQEHQTIQAESKSNRAVELEAQYGDKFDAKPSELNTSLDYPS